MDAQRFARVKEIVLTAAALAERERAAYVREACAGDPALEGEVSSLLAQQTTKSGPLDTGALEFYPSGTAASARRIPERIGPYRILEILGEGGMGIVYRAEQEKPRRTVALKVILSGLASAAHRRRFEYEAEVLGRLQHRGIAQIYEAGTAAIGEGSQPFFAMEFVRGDTLQVHVERNAVDTRGRLELLASICDAVHYAHQKGIIHRDLKPGNVLVDSSGQPKILDFGVACATDADVLATTMHTATGHIVGTVQYMSPEQAAGDSRQIDTRSDVYALGVIGYELLAGRPPHDFKDKMLHEAVRMIREEDAPPLSTVNRSLRGDLETILLKALEKDKERRFESAAALAADIRRYLRSEPILSRPRSTMYQLRKFAERNRALVGGVMAVIAVLVVGIVVSAMQYVRAEASRKEAVAARDTAVEEAGKAEAVTKFLQDMLASANPDTARGREVAVREVLDASAESIEGSFAGRPLVEAAIRYTLGRTYWALGDFNRAEPHYRRALEIRTAELGRDHRDTLEVESWLGDLLSDRGDFEKAEPLLLHATETASRVLGEDHELTLSALDVLGFMMSIQRRHRESEELLRKVVAAKRAKFGDGHTTTLFSLMHLAGAVIQGGRLEDAEALFREGYDRCVAQGDRDTRLLLSFQAGVGSALSRQNRLEEAEPILRDCLASRLRVYGEDHKLVAQSLTSLGDLCRRKGDFAEAEALLRRAVGIADRIDSRVDAGWARRTLIGTLLEQDKAVEAHAVWLEIAGAVRARAIRAGATAQEMSDYASFLLRAQPEKWRDPETALEFAERVAALPEGKTAAFRSTLALAYSLTGASDRAVQAQEEALALLAPSAEHLRPEMEATLAQYRAAAQAE